MSSKTANWIIGAGVVLMFVGLCFFSALLSDHPEPDMLEFGACQFSLGALVIAAGIYAKARTIQFAIAAGEPRKESSTFESTGSGWLRFVRHRSSSSAMQSPPTSSLWKLSGSTLRCSLLRLRADHPHRQQERQKRGGACPGRLAAVAVSRTLAPARCTAKVTGVTWSNYVT